LYQNREAFFTFLCGESFLILKNYVKFLSKPIDKVVKRMYNYNCKQKVYTEFIQKMRI